MGRVNRGSPPALWAASLDSVWWHTGVQLLHSEGAWRHITYTLYGWMTLHVDVCKQYMYFAHKIFIFKLYFSRRQGMIKIVKREKSVGVRKIKRTYLDIKLKSGISQCVSPIWAVITEHHRLGTSQRTEIYCFYSWTWDDQGLKPTSGKGFLAMPIQKKAVGKDNMYAHMHVCFRRWRRPHSDPFARKNSRENCHSQWH